MIAPLPKEFRSHGYHFKQLVRSKRHAMFQKSKPGRCTLSYEVVEIQSHNGYEIAGHKVEPAEHMPSSEQWGSKGWTYTDRSRAMNKFVEIS